MLTKLVTTKREAKLYVCNEQHDTDFEDDLRCLCYEEDEGDVMVMTMRVMLMKRDGDTSYYSYDGIYSFLY